MSTETKFFLWLAGGSLFLFVTSLGANSSVSKFAAEFRSEVRRMSGALLAAAIIGAVVTAIVT